MPKIQNIYWLPSPPFVIMFSTRCNSNQLSPTQYVVHPATVLFCQIDVLWHRISFLMPDVSRPSLPCGIPNTARLQSSVAVPRLLLRSGPLDLKHTLCSGSGSCGDSGDTVVQPCCRADLPQASQTAVENFSCALWIQPAESLK